MFKAIKSQVTKVIIIHIGIKNAMNAKKGRILQYPHYMGYWQISMTL